jgi:hypothetical protein
MAVLPFHDLYISECDLCGTDLEDWEWLEDDMVFHTSCTCGTEYTLEPTTAVLSSETSDLIDDDDESEE